MSRSSKPRLTSYDPHTFRPLTFHDRVPAFFNATDTPRAYLERCLETIDTLEADVLAWATLNVDGARKAADAATARYRANRPLSALDGMPIGIKDLIDTADMPTALGYPLFKDRRPEIDAAMIYALRQSGVIMLGKTTTVTLGGGTPPATRNPFDTRRTPGGSSSGSAAAVGAAMVPVAIGTHGRGSTIRPASFCACAALKPTWGAINHRGAFSVSPSTDHVGILAGSLADMWTTARLAAKIAGGNPSCPGLYGNLEAPPPLQPRRLIRLDTAGWAKANETARQSFEAVLARLAAAGVEIVSRRDDGAVESYEQQIASVSATWAAIANYERRWPLLPVRDIDPEAFPDRLGPALENAREMSEDAYRAALIDQAHLRASHENIIRRADAMITLSAPGAAPIGTDQGSAVFNEASSVLGAPAINVPVLVDQEMPLGIQLLGSWHGDERLTAIARWIGEDLCAGPAA